MKDETARVESLIDFTISFEDVKRKFIHALCAEKKTPVDIYENLKIISFSKIYVPVFGYYGKYNVNWMASIGYLRPPSVILNADGRAKSNKAMLKSDLDYSYSFAQNSFTGSYRYLILAAELKNPVPGEDEIYSSTTWNRNEAHDINISGMDCIFLECTGNIVDLFKNKANILLKDQISEQITSSLPGDSYKDLSWNANYTEQKQGLIWIPSYRIEYSYKNKAYTFAINGKDLDKWVMSFPVDEESGFLKRAFNIGGRNQIKQSNMEVAIANVDAVFDNSVSIDIFQTTITPSAAHPVTPQPNDSVEEASSKPTALPVAAQQMTAATESDNSVCYKQGEANIRFTFGNLYVYGDRLEFVANIKPGKPQKINIYKYSEIECVKCGKLAILEVQMKSGKFEAINVGNAIITNEWVDCIASYMNENG